MLLIFIKLLKIFRGNIYIFGISFQLQANDPHETRRQSLLLSVKKSASHEMLHQKTIHMAHTTFLRQILAPFIEEQPNCRTIIAQGV